MLRESSEQCPSVEHRRRTKACESDLVQVVHGTSVHDDSGPFGCLTNGGHGIDLISTDDRNGEISDVWENDRPVMGRLCLSNKTRDIAIGYEETDRWRLRGVVMSGKGLGLAQTPRDVGFLCPSAEYLGRPG